MADVWGQLLDGIGTFLNAIYELIPSYGLAIILLTIIVRLILFPLGVKQIRSMSAMQRIQPKLKEIQKKHKGDRQRLNEEMMKLYREHGVNPLGGCFPLVLQMPVFIALYAVIRSAIPYQADLEAPVPITVKLEKETICRPAGIPSAGGITEVTCVDKAGTTQTFKIVTAQRLEGSKFTGPELEAFPPFVRRCAVIKDPANAANAKGIKCETPFGTGHLPENGKLFTDIVDDRASFLGMHLACSPTQTLSKTAIQQCTADEKAGSGVAVVMSFLLVVLMAGTTYYQQKQMSKRAPAGPQAQQMQMMGRIMPLFMGFLSLNFPTALSLYWVVGNFWMIGQQHVILNKMMPPEGGGSSEEPAKGGKKPASPNGPSKSRGKPKR
jgi:YidC/Oxa1 family membrane protein insertase